MSTSDLGLINSWLLQACMVEIQAGLLPLQNMNEDVPRAVGLDYEIELNCHEDFD